MTLHWIGSEKLTHCQLCHRDMRDDMLMYDANIGSTWANICDTCFESLGCKLGIGYGQKYSYNESDNKWYQVKE